MRVLAVPPGPNFSVADVHRGWVKAFNNLGAQVYDWPFDAVLEWYERAKAGHDTLTTEEAAILASRTVERIAYRFWPDVILITSAFYIPNDTLDLFVDRGHQVVLLHTESPYEDDRQIKRAEHVTLNVVNDPTNIDRFPDGTIYLPHAYDPDIHHPGRSEHDHDFVMVGTGYPSRVDFLEAVEWPCEPVLCGNWQSVNDDSPLIDFLGHKREECFPNELAADLYRGSRSSLNLYRREATSSDLVDGWAMGPREVELAACGTFYLTEARGENREVLPMVPTVDGPEDFSEKLAWWLAHPSEREAVAAEALAAVADRTFTSNARRLLQLVT